MINLIPKEDKIEIKKEYTKRIILVVGTMLFVAISFLALLILPMYFSLNPVENRLKNREEVARNSLATTKGDETLKNVRELEERAHLIVESEGERPSPFLVINEVAKAKREEISVNTIIYNKDSLDNGKVSSTVVISGVARRREDLVAFVSSLKANTRFKEIDVPILSFLKSEKADFQITLKTSF